MIQSEKRKFSISDIPLLALVISIWAFNEEKIITYPIKIAFIAIYMYKFMTKGGKLNGYQGWCLIMTAISALAALIAPYSNIAIQTFINVLQVFLIGFVISGNVNHKEDFEKACIYIVIAGVVLAVRLFIVTPLSVWISFKRLGEAIHYNSNDVGNKAAISAIIAICFFKSSKNKLLLICFGILSIITLFSGSRKALISVVLAVILLFTIGLENKKNIVFSIMGISAFLIIGYLFIMHNEILYATIGRRIESMINVFLRGGSESTSIDLRYKYMNAAIELIKKSPLFGVGLGNFAVVSGIGRYCHNDYLEVACSYGVIGALIYYMIYTNLLVYYIRMKKRTVMDTSCLIIVVVLLVEFLTMVMYISAYTQVILALMWANYYIKKENNGESFSN